MININKDFNLTVNLLQQEKDNQLQKASNLPREINIRTLKPKDKLISEKVLSVGVTTIKIAFAPITLLCFLIGRSLSTIASSIGLGTEKEVKSIDDFKRKKLLSIGGEKIKFAIKGQSVLEGMFFGAEKKFPHSKTILLCTGSHLSYEHYALPMVKALKSMGHHVLAFNYEGFGDSEGRRSEEGVYRSVEAAYQYLKQEKGCSDDSIIAWGYSLGSGAVSELALNHSVDIVIDRGFSSMSKVAYESAPNGLRTVAKIIFTIGAHFDNLRKLSKSQGHIFIAQGKWDSGMANHGHCLKQALANNQKMIFREVNSAHLHNDDVWFTKNPDRQAIEKFLSR